MTYVWQKLKIYLLSALILAIIYLDFNLAFNSYF